MRFRLFAVSVRGSALSSLQKCLHAPLLGSGRQATGKLPSGAMPMRSGNHAFLHTTYKNPAKRKPPYTFPICVRTSTPQAIVHPLLLPPPPQPPAQVLAFGLGALTSMPAVRNFSICAAIAVGLDFLLQVRGG